MSAQHTPGPWQATTGIPPMSYYVTHQERKNGKHVSYMVCAIGDSPVAEADARLIAAAPEMLGCVFCPTCYAYMNPDHQHVETVELREAA